MQVAPNGRYAYIANRDAGEVTVLDTTLDQVTGHIPIEAAPPRFITFSPDGRTAYVTVYTDDKTVNAVVVLDTADNTVRDTVPVGTRPFAPATTLGRALAVLLMLTGYGIIAVPTGIVTVELTRAAGAVPVSAQACPGCGLGAHEHDSVYCRRCGTKL